MLQWSSSSSDGQDLRRLRDPRPHFDFFMPSFPPHLRVLLISHDL